MKINFLFSPFPLFFQRHESESESLLGGGGAAGAAGASGLDDPSSSPSASSASSAAAAAIAGVSDSAAAAAAADADGLKEGGKKKKNRCLSCKKKVGLTGTYEGNNDNTSYLHA